MRAANCGVACCKCACGAKHEIVRAAAHLAAVEQPDVVNELIEEHLR